MKTLQAIIDKGHKDLDPKLGRKSKFYWKKVNSLFSPENYQILEYRENGVVIRETEPFNYFMPKGRGSYDVLHLLESNQKIDVTNYK